MAITRPPRTVDKPSAAARPREATGEMDGRLGLDQPAGWWPTPPRLKSYEAAGFSYVQVRMPPREVLADPSLVQVHATALRENLRLTRLRLILHAPDDLLAGSREQDRQLDGAIAYAGVADAKLIVYHGARIRIDHPLLLDRLGDEERSLRRALPHAERLGVRIAIENLAPVYPGVEHASNSPMVVAALARRLDSEHAGLCIDIGHAHIAAGIAGCDVAELIEPVLDRALVLHLHDNFGGDPIAARAGGIEPARLDLHLAPGAGTVPWKRLRGLILGSGVGRETPVLLLEIHPAQRPEPGTLAVLTREVLGVRSGIARAR